jgi:TP901 family phage tail tape measure protein
MAEDANARIRVDIDTAAALANIKNLQRQISTFHTSLAKSGAQATASSLQLQQSLINGINKTGQFSAGIKTIKTTTDSFTNSLQKNKLSMGEYFRYSAAATKTFGRFFSSEFDTINKVARERVKDLQTQYIKMGRDANGAMRAIAVRPLALDMENLATKTQIAAQRQALLNQMLKQGSTNLLNFGKNTQWAGRQLMVGFTVPLVMLGAVAAKTFMDLEKQAVRFKRVYGEMFTTSEQTEKALADIKELANEFTKYGIAVAKTMELAADIAATGKMGAELNAQVSETTRLAVLGGVEQSKALEATISITDAFGVSAENLAGKIDFLNAVENQTITSIEDLTIAIPKAGPVVQQLGGDVEDLTFFLTAMREGGINASEGANALKSGLASLINPTRQASDMLSGFGINIKGIVDANEGDVKGLIIDFAEALDELSPLNRAQAIEQLFGKFQFARMSTLFQNVIKEGNQASRVLKLTNATTAELAVLSEREMRKIEESPMFKFQKALEDLKVSLAPVGEAFLKAVTPLLEFGTSVLKKFDELDENSKGFVVGLTAIAGVIGPVFLMGFGLIANGVANIIKGFVFFKTVLNKAGSASTQLGMQTEYMTQQQLEAAAVAASLDQVHSKLRQTFTSEAAAINALTAAYDRAIIKQMAFAGTPMAVGRGAKAGPKKYASGVISVPGPKGAGDIVPAMLSPGEAIIPAEKAEKYRGFIEALIAGNIPGFFSGAGNVAAPTPPKPERASNYIQGPFDKPIEESKKPAQLPAKVTSEQDYVRAIAKKEIAGSGFSSSPDEVRKQTESKSWAGMDREMAAKKAEIEKMRQEGRKISSSQERSLLKPTPDAAHVKQSSYKVSVAGRQIPTKSWMARSLMADDPMVNRYAAQANLEKDGGGTKSTQNALKSMMDPKGQDALAKKLGVSQKELNKQLKLLSQGISPSTAGGSKVMQELAKRDPKPNQGRLAAAALRARDDFAKKNPGKGFYETLGSRKYDPSKDEAVKKKQEAATAKANERAKAKVARLTKAQQDESARVFKKSQEAEKAKIAAVEKDTKQVKASTKEQVAATKVVKDNKKETAKNTKTTKEATKTSAKLAVPAGPAQAQRVTARETKQGTRYYSGNKLVADQKAGQIRYNRQQGAAKGVETRRANAAAKAQAPQNAQAKPQGQMGGRLGMAGMVASGAVMAGSMLPGEVGKTAQNLMMPVMMLSMILPMLTSKFALIAAAVVGLIAAFVLVQMAIAGIRKESAELTRSMSSGKESMSMFAEMAGTVTASEYMRKRREQEISPFNVETGKTTFGQAFIGSEDGTAMLEGFEKQTEVFGRSRAIDTLQKQLVTAVATGVLSTEQAQSIAKSLGQKLNDYGITANINAAIQSIVGPDGEVLEGNTIKIYTEYIEGSTDGITGTGGILQTEDLTGGAPIWWWDTEKVAKREGEAAGIIANFFDENQQLIDAFDAENLKRIDVLYDEGKYDEALAAEEAYQIERQNLVGLYSEQTAQLVSDFGGVEFSKQQGILTGMVDLIKQTDPLAGVAAEKLRNSTTDTGIDILGQSVSTENVAWLDEYMSNIPGLGLGFRALSGGQTFMEAAGLRQGLDAAQNDFQEVKVQFLGMLEGGNITTETFNGLMDMFDPTSSTGQATLSVLAKISTQVGPQALDQLETIFEVMDNPELAAEVAVNIGKIEDPDAAASAINTLEQLATFDGVAVEPKIVLDFYGDPNKLEDLAEKFEKLDHLAEQGKLNITTMVEQQIITSGDAAAFAEHQAYFDTLEPVQQVKYMQVLVSQRAVVAENEIDAWFEGNPDSKRTRSQVADLLAHEEAIQYTVANKLNDSTTVEDEDTGGGGSGPSASPLDDLLKKLRDLRKNQIGVTKGFEASAAAINKLFGGGAGINLFSGIENDMRRLGAGEDLVSLIAGMDPEEFESKKNTLFNFDKQTGEIIGFKEQLVNIGRALSAIALGQYVSDQQKSAKESRNQVLAFNQLRAAGYSVAEAYETVQDASVAAAVATGDVTREQLDTMLAELRAAQDAMKEAARLTPEGLQEVFEDGFNKAMEAFDVKEKKLTLEYELQIADDQALVDEAQNQIAAIRYELDDYEADLRGIEDQERAINETYDEKVKALEDVRKANQKVLDQEKGKLSVAEAISRGDLAAAARAAQDVRATSASGYFSSQTDALEAGRQSALDQVRGEDGLSRIEIEEKIKDLTDQIFEIEEKTLEPAQERIRLAGIELQARIDELTELGKTKAEWETIKNNIDLARVNSAGYKSAMEEALAVVEDVKDAWGGIQDKTVTLTTIQKTVVEGTASGPNSYGPGTGTTPDPTDVVNPLNGLTATQQADLQAQVDTLSNSLPGLQQVIANAKKEQAEAVRIYNMAHPNATKALADRVTRANTAVAKAQKAYNDALASLSTARNQINPPSRGPANGGGGRTGPVIAAEGGPITGPGTGTSDSIPAMLSDGEYVIKAASAKKLGRRFLDSVNAGKPRPFPGMIKPRPLPAFNKPYPMPQIIPDDGMVYAGGSPYFNESTGTYNKPRPLPAFNKPSFKLPGMGIARPSMPQIPSGTIFDVPNADELRKQAAAAMLLPQPPANNNSSVYNYNLSVNVASQSDPNTIAQTVMAQLQRVESQRIRNGRL